MEFIFVVIGIGLFIYLYRRAETTFTFSYGIDVANFNGQIIAFDKILKIERDLGSIESKTMYFAYIITYYNENSEITTSRIYLALTDRGTWNAFKDKLSSINPTAIINESIL